VTSLTSERFRKTYRELPEAVQRRARFACQTFRDDPFHPSLQFKQVHAMRPSYSVRAGLGYRALGVREGDAVIWFWIGSHAEYDRLVARV